MDGLEGPAAGWTLLFARSSLALVFLVSAVHKAGWYSKAMQEFRDARVPFVGLVLPATILLHFGGSLCLILGIFTAEASIGLAVFTLLATERVHGYWRFVGPARLARSRDALANLGIIGGLLILAVVGPGRFALGAGG